MYYTCTILQLDHWFIIQQAIIGKVVRKYNPPSPQKRVSVTCVRVRVYMLPLPNCVLLFLHFHKKTPTDVEGLRDC